MGASQKVWDAQRNGDIGEFIDHLNGGRERGERPLTGEQIMLGKTSGPLGKWMGMW